MRSRCLIVDIDQCYQHQQTSRKGINKELECDQCTILTTPNEANEINRDKGHFPEEVEQKSISRHEHTNQCRLHHEDQSVKCPWLVVRFIKRRQNDERCQDCRQQNKQ